MSLRLGLRMGYKTCFSEKWRHGLVLEGWRTELSFSVRLRF